MSVDKVKNYLAPFNLPHTVQETEQSSATVELAALAVGVIPARIAKSLTFKSALDNHCIMIVTAGDGRVDNKKFKALFHRKASMLPADEALVLTGHAVGGVCPFALPDDTVTVYLDANLKRFETIFPACGSANSAIEMTCEELYVTSRAEAWIDVCKDLPEGE